MKTHYDVLGLKKTCDQREIREAFLKLSKLHHPDKNPAAGAVTKFQEINEAYLTLSKKDTRRAYDESLLFNNFSQSTSYPQGMNYASPQTPYNYYRSKYSRQSADFNTSHSMFTTRKLTIFVFFALFLGVGSAFEVRRAMRIKLRRDRLILRAVKETEERSKLLGKEKVVEMLRAGTYRGVTVADIEKKLEGKEK